MPEILFIHIVSASFALLGAYAALVAPKGGVLHKRAGMFFVWSMIVMGVAASILGRAKGDLGVAGPMIVYLVITGVATMRKPDTMPRWLPASLMVMGFAISTWILGACLMAAADPRPDEKLGAGFITGGLLLIAALGDVRVVLRGPLRGSARLLRHMWRMCYAAFAATGSFFLGQADEIPEPLRIWPVLIFLAFLPALAMLYYFVREAWRRRRLRERAPVHSFTHVPVEAVR